MSSLFHSTSLNGISCASSCLRFWMSSIVFCFLPVYLNFQCVHFDCTVFFFLLFWLYFSLHHSIADYVLKIVWLYVAFMFSFTFSTFLLLLLQKKKINKNKYLKLCMSAVIYFSPSSQQFVSSCIFVSANSFARRFYSSHYHQSFHLIRFRFINDRCHRFQDKYTSAAT